MSASIGSVSVDLFFGTVASIKTRTEVFDVFGQNGTGVLTGGKGDASFSLQTVFYAATEVDSSNHISDCEDLQGTIVTITDQFDETFTDCLIVHVETQNAQKSVRIGASNKVRTEISWQCQRVK